MLSLQMQEANGEGHLGPNQGKVQQARVSPEHRPRLCTCLLPHLHEGRDDQSGRWWTGVKPPHSPTPFGSVSFVPGALLCQQAKLPNRK